MDAPRPAESTEPPDKEAPNPATSSEHHIVRNQRPLAQPATDGTDDQAPGSPETEEEHVEVDDDSSVADAPAAVSAPVHTTTPVESQNTGSRPSVPAQASDSVAPLFGWGEPEDLTPEGNTRDQYYKWYGGTQHDRSMRFQAVFSTKKGFHIRVGSIILLVNGNEAYVAFIIKHNVRGNLSFLCVNLNSGQCLIYGFEDIEQPLRTATEEECTSCEEIVQKYLDRRRQAKQPADKTAPQSATAQPAAKTKKSKRRENSKHVPSRTSRRGRPRKLPAEQLQEDEDTADSSAQSETPPQNVGSSSLPQKRRRSKQQSQRPVKKPPPSCQPELDESENSQLPAPALVAASRVQPEPPSVQPALPLVPQQQLSVGQEVTEVLHEILEQLRDLRQPQALRAQPSHAADDRAMPNTQALQSGVVFPQLIPAAMQSTQSMPLATPCLPAGGASTGNGIIVSMPGLLLVQQPIAPPQLPVYFPFGPR